MVLGDDKRKFLLLGFQVSGWEKVSTAQHVMDTGTRQDVHSVLNYIKK